jgi:hypothetical protein
MVVVHSMRATSAILDNSCDPFSEISLMFSEDMNKLC